MTVSGTLFGEYQSQTTRQLAKISSSKYPDTNKDFEANLQRLNQFVDYIAQYLTTMQKGLDQANADTITRIRDMVADMTILLGGGELLYGIDLGDLQYFLPAIGAIFGFDSETPFPLNLFDMAQHFFLGYVVPLDAFLLTIQDIINGWATAMGLDAEFVAALNEVMDEMILLGTTLLDILNDLWDLLEIFGINTDGFGPFADIWHVVTVMLGELDLEMIGTLTDPVLELLAPWLKEMAELLAWFNQVLQAFSGGLTDVQGILRFAQMFTPYIDFISGWTTPAAAWSQIIIDVLNPSGLIEAVAGGVATAIDIIGIGQISDLVRNLLPNPSFLEANSISQGGGVWDWVNDIVHGTGGSATAGANGTLRELLSDPPTEVVPGEVLDVSQWLRWTGVTATAGQPAFGLGLTFYDALNNIVATPNLNTVVNPAAASANPTEDDFIKLLGTYTVPANAKWARQRLTIFPAALTGATWWGDGSLGKTQMLDADWLDDWQNLLDVLSGASAGLGSLVNMGLRMFALNPDGTVDASQLSNMTNLPVIPDLLGKAADFQVLNDNISNALSGMSIVGDELFGTELPTAKTVMEQLFNSLSANTRKIQQLETNQTAANVGGRQYNINFSDYPNGPFPSGLFNITMSGPGTSSLAIQDGKAVWNLVNNGDKTAFLLYPQTMATDFMIVRGTMASPPENNDSGQKPRIWAIARSNAVGTDYVWARGYCTGFLSFKGDIGCTKAGVDHVWLSNVSLTWSLDMRLICGVGTNPRRHMVLSGDTIVVDLIEPAGAQSIIDADHRWWGSRSDTNGVNTSGAIAGASVSDNAPPAVVGTTFRASKRTAQDVTINSGGQAVPNNFYETIDYITTDLIYRPGTNCEIEITKTGTYVVEWRAYHGLFFQGTGGHGLLYKKAAGGAYVPYARANWGDTQTSFNAVASKVDATTGFAILALNPGDCIKPGFHFTSNMSNTGDNVILADGSQSWFAVTRVGI
jgi:hypothetical protein